MPDAKPPRLVDDERTTLMALLQYQRESLVRKVAGVDPVAAATSPVPSGTTLTWLVAHLAWAELLWVVERFAGEPFQSEASLADDSPESAVAAYRAAWTRVDAIVAANDLAQQCQPFGDGSSVNLRWIVAHLLEETARHAGHADILRELIDGETGR